MSVTDLTLSATGLPVATWRLDPVHSSASFAVKHMAVATFRGRFERLDATLTVDDEWPQVYGLSGHPSGLMPARHCWRRAPRPGARPALRREQ